ncbi:pseudaminic acid synthase [Candidatus Pelagibacter bacterium]|nr:pseudaminic acid synthase [Candidatus Pelagibacter bacterium]
MLNRYPTLVAEISANHNGSLSNAKKLIQLAKKSGFDYVKLQTYEPQTMTLNSKKKEFKIKKGLWKNKTLWDLYTKAQTPFGWQEKLFDYCKKLKIKCFSTPFDETAVELLEKLNCPMYKIASFEITHIPLIEKVSKTKKPVIISTGMATIKDIDLAYDTAYKNGAKEIALLYCISNYPAKNSDFNLRSIEFLKKRYKCKVGFSDHSIDNSVAKTALASGAEIFEKHIALKNVKAADYKFSLKGNELKDYTEELKKTSKLLGKFQFKHSSSQDHYKNLRRSIYALKAIKKGEKFSIRNISIVRPGYGLSPKYFKKIINKKSPYKIEKYSKVSKNIIKKMKVSVE